MFDPISIGLALLLSTAKEALQSEAAKAVFSGIIGNRADYLYTKGLNKIKDIVNLRNSKYPENHDLLRALRMSMLKATQMLHQSMKNDNEEKAFRKVLKKWTDEQIKYLPMLNKWSDWNNPATSELELFFINSENYYMRKAELIEKMISSWESYIHTELQINLPQAFTSKLKDGWIENERRIYWHEATMVLMIEALRNPKDEGSSKAAKAFEHNFLSDMKLQISDIHELLISQFANNEAVIQLADTIASQQSTIESQQHTIKILVEDNEYLRDELVTAIKHHKNFPKIEVNQTYTSLNQKIEELKEREKYLKAEIEHRKAESYKELQNTDKERNHWLIQQAEKEFIKTNSERNETKKRLNHFVIEIINLSNFLKSQNIVTKRGKEAERLFYLGKFEDAISILNDKDIYTDIEKNKDGLKGLAKELLFKAKAIEITQPDECFEKAKKYYKDAIKTHKNFDTCLSYAHFLSKYNFNSQALEYYQKAFSDTSAETPENSYKIFRSYGECMMNLKKYKDAETFLRSALKVKQENNSNKEQTDEIGGLYINIGLSIREQGNYSQAIIEFGTALKIFQDLEKNDTSFKYFVGKVYSELAASVSCLDPQQIRIYPNEKSFSKLTEAEYLQASKVIENLSLEDKINAKKQLAEEYYQKSIEIFRDGLKNGNSDWSIGLYDALYNYAHFQENPQKAEPILTEALSIAEDLFNKNAAIYLRDLAQTQRRMFYLRMALKDLKSAHDNLLNASVSYYYLMEVDPKTFGETYAKTFMDLGLFNIVHKKPSKETNELARKYAMTALHFFESRLGENISNLQSHINQCNAIIKEATIRDYRLEEKENDG